MMETISPEDLQEKKLYREWGLTDNEYSYIVKDVLKRLPNYTETGLFSVMWSEHCSYKHSKNLLKKFPTTGEQVLQGPGEGAGIVDIGDNLAVVFKAESHNHPSAIEPYEGAATGVGGIIRDIFSMGARPIALLDSLRFGELDNPQTRYLLEEVVHGISGYGNCIGIPTVGGEVSFDACYEGNPLVNAMCVGLIEHQQIQVGKAGGSGNTLLYVGAKTGRDGIHGATFASEEFDSEGTQQRSAVQVGDPFMEKQLMEACLKVVEQYPELVVGMQDMGAAGLVSSSAEMASKTGEGIVLYLDKVPQRETNMTPYEIMLSESQERMLLCLQKDSEQQVIDLFHDFGLDAVIIGEVTSDQRYRLNFKNEEVVDLPIWALTDAAPVYDCDQKARVRSHSETSFSLDQQDYTELTYRLLAQPTIASKKMIYETYDYQVQTNTVVAPGSDAAVVRIKGTNKALAITMDCNQRFVYLDPKIGGSLTIAEAARNIVASGGKPLAITDCLNYGNPENPEIYWELSESIDGMSEACQTLGTPVISGNVSLYNETDGKAIYPTPIIGMVGLIEDLQHITTQFWKNSDDLIYVIGETKADFAGSEVQKLLTGDYQGSLASFDLTVEKENQMKVLEAIQSGLVKSAHDCSEGGLIVALLESAFDKELGASLTVDFSAEYLFSESPSRFVVSIAPENKDKFEEFVGSAAVYVGTTNDSHELCIETQTETMNIDVAKAKQIWEDALSCVGKIKV